MHQMISDPKALIEKSFDQEQFTRLIWTGSFDDFLDVIMKNPLVCMNAWQRLYLMIERAGVDEVTRFKKRHTCYRFFRDHATHPIFGLEPAIEELVETIKAGAMGYGPERRIMLLHGPVGSSKSTICTSLKRGLETFTASDGGELYTFGWNICGEDVKQGIDPDIIDCPIHEEPLNLLPRETRAAILKMAVDACGEKLPFKISVDGDLCPACKFYFDHFMRKYEGDLSKTLDHVVVKRFVLDEKTRHGIGTFQPKDEKNQDATELTGDINFRKLGSIGVDSDPRCFNFDGEFQVANRGLFELIEMLKLNDEFLYDMLGASQEKQIKPKKFSQMTIDEVLLGHTNNPEFEALKADDKMEALKDRTIRIDIPYLLRWDDEIRIYEHVYNESTVPQHIAPHTLEIAALWVILTRLQDPLDGSVTLVEKAKLYNGQSLPGWTEDKVKELRENAEFEGLHGISARFVQNVISNVLVARGRDCINAFQVLNEIASRLKDYALIGDEDERKRCVDLVADVTKEWDEIIKDEVRKVLIGDEDAIERLCTQYIDNICAYVEDTKVVNPITEREEPPNERLMRSIEEKIGVGEHQIDDFRRSVMTHMGSVSQKGNKFDWKTDPRLKEALQAKLFEDTKDTVKLARLSSGAAVVDRDIQEKIDSLKQRLMRDHGYCDQCAADILEYASSIFARGDIMNND